jgi:hypothetical protein
VLCSAVQRRTVIQFRASARHLPTAAMPPAASH